MFKNVKMLTTTALLVALATICGFFKIPINQVVEIRFAFLPIACAGALYGPVVGAVVGALSDILGFIVRPTGPFFPGFTLNAAIQGILFGFFLYKKEPTLMRCTLANFIQTLIVTLLLTPLWLTVLYTMDFKVVLASRMIKTLIMFPIETAMLYGLIKVLFRIEKEHV
ncbi:MAG: folate family ECF transporter S component [Erysipelotrichaceae bacterium]|jgi:ECF transporter S component (folate family)|nr:folate family ECF transporter S component [Erysipelotrichaceae bacterium]